MQQAVDTLESNKSNDPELAVYEAAQAAIQAFKPLKSGPSIGDMIKNDEDLRRAQTLIQLVGDLSSDFDATFRPDKYSHRYRPELQNLSNELMANLPLSEYRDSEKPGDFVGPVVLVNQVRRQLSEQFPDLAKKQGAQR